MFGPWRNGLSRRTYDSLEIAFSIYSMLAVRGCMLGTFGEQTVLALQVGRWAFLYSKVERGDLV